MGRNGGLRADDFERHPKPNPEVRSDSVSARRSLTSVGVYSRVYLHPRYIHIPIRRRWANLICRARRISCFAHRLPARLPFLAPFGVRPSLSLSTPRQSSAGLGINLLPTRLSRLSPIRHAIFDIRPTGAIYTLNSPRNLCSMRPCPSVDIAPPFLFPVLLGHRP